MGKNNHKKPNGGTLVPEERRRQISELLQDSGSVTIAVLQEQFGISPMTARRDLTILENERKIQRTHGGAVLPRFAGHEDSFQQRLEENVAAKERLAEAAVELLEPGETLFIDSSTTAYYATKRILEREIRVTLMTNSVPVMQLFTAREAPSVELIGTGGTMKKLTLSFVGPHTVRSVSSHYADKVFVSVKGIAPDGYLTDPDPLEAEVKRAMIANSEDAVLLVEGSKLEQKGLNAIVHCSKVSRVLVVDALEERLERLSEAGVEVQRVL